MMQQSVRVVSFSVLERWDVKYYAGQIKSQYPLVLLSKFVMEHNEKVRPSDSPNETFKILGVNNIDGIFHAYDALGKDINQPYKKVSKGDFAYNPYRINVGSIGWVQPDYDGDYISPAYVVFSLNSKSVLPEVFWFILKSDFFNQSIRAATAGSVRMNLTYSLLKSLKIPMIPTNIQQKIVKYWNEVQHKKLLAEQSFTDLVEELSSHLIDRTQSFYQATNSKLFRVSYSKTQQWDVKAGRAAVFISANPHFVRLGNYIEECLETVSPWEYSEKEWPIYGVNNKVGVFLSSKQKGKDFNAPYKTIKKDWFVHNPTRANVGSLGIVPDVSVDAITSPEYQVWKLKGGFLPAFMALMIHTNYFLSLVAFNRVGGVKQRMYYSNLAEIRLPMIEDGIQEHYAKRREQILENILVANQMIVQRKKEIEQMILGMRPVGVS